MDKLLHKLSQMNILSDDFVQSLKERMVRTSLARNHVLVEASQISQNAYYLSNGFAMSFRYLKRKKFIEDIYQGGSLMVATKSFFERTPSKSVIQLLEDSDVYLISYESVQWLCDHFPEARSIYLTILSVYIEEGRERIRDLQLLNGRERYAKLIAAYPRIHSLLSLEQIATYLGIAPQTLSRIRRESSGM